MCPAKIAAKRVSSHRSTSTSTAAAKKKTVARTPKKPKPASTPKVTDGFRPAATTATRPGAVRNAGELGAPWRAVQLAESSGSARSLIGNQAFKDQVAGDLMNFLKMGGSSLTRYETNQLTQGLLGASVDYHGYGEAEKYSIGDRLEFATKNAEGKTVTQRGIYYGSGVLTALDGKFTLLPLMNPDRSRPITIDRVIAGALVDGR